jgi:hypothetical protein
MSASRVEEMKNKNVFILVGVMKKVMEEAVSYRFHQDEEG